MATSRSPVGVVAVLIAGAVRRSLLARGSTDPGERIQAASIACFAVAEVPAILGIVVCLATGVRELAYALFILSLLGLAVYFPRASQWEEWALAIQAEATRLTR